MSEKRIFRFDMRGYKSELNAAADEFLRGVARHKKPNLEDLAAAAIFSYSMASSSIHSVLHARLERELRKRGYRKPRKPTYMYV